MTKKQPASWRPPTVWSIRNSTRDRWRRICTLLFRQFFTFYATLSFFLFTQVGDWPVKQVRSAVFVVLCSPGRSIHMVLVVENVAGRLEMSPRRFYDEPGHLSPLICFAQSKPWMFSGCSIALVQLDQTTVKGYQWIRRFKLNFLHYGHIFLCCQIHSTRLLYSLAFS